MAEDVKKGTAPKGGKRGKKAEGGEDASFQQEHTKKALIQKIAELRDEEAIRDKHKAAFESAKGKCRNIVKTIGGFSETLGIPKAKVADYLKQLLMDPDEVSAEQAARAKFFDITGYPVGTQFGLFPDKEGKPSSIATIIETRGGVSNAPAKKVTTVDAYKQGAEAFRTGATLEANKFEVGTALYDHWKAGFEDTRDEAVRTLGGDKTAPAGASVN